VSLSDIPVRVQTGALTGNARAVLLEIETLLDALVRTGEGGSIDIGGLPLSEADLVWLQEQLGRGEVTINLSIGGESSIIETAFPGVWWITHQDQHGQMSSQFIEVDYQPELLAAHPDDVENGLGYLKSRIADLN
jgi:hydrogenase-1 operon protein HyaF